MDQQPLRLPPTAVLTANRITTSGPTTVATGTRRLYTCISYYGLFDSYNEMRENIENYHPDGKELTEWYSKNLTRIGQVVSAGVGEDFHVCFEPFRQSSWVTSSQITKTCYPSNLFRSACFTSWQTTLATLELPTFPEVIHQNSANFGMYSVDGHGSRFPATLGYYNKYNEFSMIVVKLPTLVNISIPLNCFVHNVTVLCVDSSISNFVVFHNISSPSGTIKNCSESGLVCYEVSALALVNLSKPKREPLSPVLRLLRGQPVPTAYASVADVKQVESAVNVNQEIAMYNFAILSKQIADIQQLSLHTALSVAKSDDLFLSNMWSQHFSTRFLNYDHFVIVPKSMPSPNNSNCINNNSLIYFAGRFVSKPSTEQCMVWQDNEVTNVPLLTNKALKQTSLSDFSHVKTAEESGWSYLMTHKQGLEEASLIHFQGGAGNSSLADLLKMPAGAISWVFRTLYGLSGFATVVCIIIVSAIILSILKR